MAKTPKQKLAVDGTAKLAARATKASDKHEKNNLSIEEATVASPRETRKRTGYFNDFEDEDGEATAEPPSKAADAPATKTAKKTKTASSDRATKEPKKTKGKTDAGDAKVDETVGDRVKADAEKPTKAKKAKATKSDVVVGPSGDTAEVDGASATKKPTKKAKANTSSKGEEAPNDKKGESVADRVAAEVASAPKKDKPAKKNVVVGPSGDTAQVDAAEPKPKNAKATPKEKTEKAAKPKKAPKVSTDGEGPNFNGAPAKETSKDETTDAKSKPKPKKSKKEADADTNVESSKAYATSTKDTTAANEVDPAPKPKKGKKDGKKAAEAANPAVEPDLAMDQGPFETLLDSSKDKPTKDAKAPKAKAGEKPKKAPKPKAEKTEKKTAPVKQKDTVKKVPAPTESSTAEPSKGKKRKASATVDAETVKSDILDPLAEHASASKKQKKDSRKSYGETFGELVNTGLEAAAQGANSLKQSFGGLTNDASKKLTDTTPEVASSLGEAKDSAKAAATKAKGKGKAAADAVASTVAGPTEDQGGKESDSSDSEPDDQTAALLKGFESDGDDEPANECEAFKEGQPIPDIPKAKDTKKQLKALKSTPETESGVVYLGRIPHGFYEHQMRSYFSQFGTIKRLRLSRSVKTGQSKHYAFIEFENEGVAKIVAGTMDNYLMFGHILKCKSVAKENLHENLWKGANKRFKAVPRNKIEGRKLAVAMGKEHWKGRVEREEKKRSEKLEKTKAIGYEFVAPALRSVDDVKKAVEGGVAGETVEEQEKSLVTVGEGEGAGSVVVSEEVKTKKTKKTKKSVKGVGEVATTVVEKTKRTLEDGAAAAEGPVKKAKKNAKKVAA